MANIGLVIIVISVFVAMLATCTTFEDDNGRLKTCKGKTCVVIGVILAFLTGFTISAMVTAEGLASATNILEAVGARVVGLIVAIGLIPAEMSLFTAVSFLRYKCKAAAHATTTIRSSEAFKQPPVEDAASCEVIAFDQQYVVSMRDVAATLYCAQPRLDKRTKISIKIPAHRASRTISDRSSSSKKDVG